MKLTIVLTVFNKEAYLNRSFAALLHQVNVQEDDYEVLVINDGSTDGSKTIIEEYEQKCSRVRVINQPNQGLSVARNNGAKAALGEYVWFVDSDDVISIDAVNKICEVINDHPDVIPIYARVFGEDSIRNAVDVEAKTGKEILLCRRWEQCGVFNILRRSFLFENELRFLPGIYHEDAEFTPRMLYYANSVRVIPEVLYTVFRVPASITQVPRPKRAFDYLSVAYGLSQFVVEKGEKKSAVGKAIDRSAAVCINNAFWIILKNEPVYHQELMESFYSKRSFLIRSLWNASQIKYRLEALILFICPKRAVIVYRMMQSLKQGIDQPV